MTATMTITATTTSQSFSLRPANDPEPALLELEVVVMETGAEVRLTLLESVTVTDTVHAPVAVGAQDSWEVSDDEHPVGRPFHVYEYGAVPPVTEAVKTIV